MVPVDIDEKDVKECLEAKLIDRFPAELCDFQNYLDPFASRHPWIIAKDENFLAHEWNEMYSLRETEVLGPLGLQGHV